jgi:hypothetical protein
MCNIIFDVNDNRTFLYFGINQIQFFGELMNLFPSYKKYKHAH